MDYKLHHSYMLTFYHTLINIHIYTHTSSIYTDVDRMRLVYILNALTSIYHLYVCFILINVYINHIISLTDVDRVRGDPQQERERRQSALLVSLLQQTLQKP